MSLIMPGLLRQDRSLYLNNGGGGEIRTLGGLSPSLVFKTSAFNRSATPPEAEHVTQ